uniref:Protein kinase domain-containing protein n=1 Tax=Amphora coffeiformis TaxID=265554 RepID=A0A7S3L6M1_9STRA|mmetsp:Transcript_1715/g.3740  ORF Transcript_1715/g.3740 Transcript_1715/m.3740 type:complete len:396 (-) Transcript_1715:68-1255(-)|eukprot:scaffold2992_cov214-Amphora_coffeaeformis.AAC.35
MQSQPEENKLKPLKHPLDPEICQKAARYAVRVCEEMSKRSTLLREEDPDELNVALFERDEILPYLGECLGKGGFNNVYELERIELSDAKLPPGQSLQRHRVLNLREKLAVKFLSDDAMYSPEEFCNGAADLLMEAKYLTALAAHPHPALIQLHGVCIAGPSGFAKPERAGFFLVIDRLYDTMDRRIDVWRELQRRKVQTKAPAKVIKALFLQRLMVAQDIASALRHLHKLEIVFRDLKPDNVGFDFGGRVKLFDFGLAKELDPKQKTDNGMYKMSGGTGSRRFMAPEVALSEPYNLSADVYSYSILLWELLSLDKAFGWLSPEEHRERCVKKNERLELRKSWSENIKNLLEGCWARDPTSRPTAREIYKMVKQEIERMYEDDFMKHDDDDDGGKE